MAAKAPTTTRATRQATGKLPKKVEPTPAAAPAPKKKAAAKPKKAAAPKPKKAAAPKKETKPKIKKVVGSKVAKAKKDTKKAVNGTTTKKTKAKA